MARADETPFSMIEANCNSWPGRASCEESVQDAAAKVKSSYSFVASPGLLGMRRGRTNSPISPVLPSSRGGRMFGAGWAALSASLASLMRTGRAGSVTRCSRRMISSISLMRFS